MTGGRGVTDESDEVLTRVEGSVGLITLNRPKAINSLNQQMVDALRAILARWEDDDAVRAVVLSGAGERGLCAGGDVVAVHDSARKDGVEVRRFWRDEYLLNAQVGRFIKPYVSLMDGIVMGGGIGISAHASTRVVTETSKIAMPEVGIGLVPDVGGAFLLSRAPGALGLHAALTGAPFSGADAIVMGFADHYVPHGELEALTAAIVSDGVEGAIARYAVDPPASELAAQRDWIDACYAGDTVADILAALRRHGGPAQDAADLISSRSPIAVSVALQAVRRAAKLEKLEDVLVQDYRVSSASARSHDLVEGIRAQIIDKDRNPKWSPATLAEVSAAAVDAYFAPVDDDLSF
jgi:enoyl-CoA hydratase